jgi:MFS transporter, Spinster family, sphingosine-1-phosphate transporter
MTARTYKNYLLTMLVIVYGFNSTERWTVGLVMQDIKLDLDLSDTQLGFLTGLSFAFFYAVMGLPIARWADRGNRVTIIALMTALQSAMVTLTGTAGNFLQLLLMRIGVAVGEAGCVPPAQSLIADYFPRGERPRATARYLMGAPLSVLIGFFVAGWLNQFYGWRSTFMLLGLPGIGVALLAWLTLREPRTVDKSATAGADFQAAGLAAMPSIKATAVTLWANVTFRQLLFALSILSFFFFGIVQWVPAFFVRTHGFQTGELGTWMTIIHGVCGLLGVYIGGEWVCRYAPEDERRQLKAMTLLMTGFAVLMPLAYLASDPYVALSVMAVANIPHAAIFGPLYATIQTLAPERMRAIAVAVILLFSNLIGTGLGPLAVGTLSDALHPVFGDESLRYALMSSCPGYLWVGWHLWRGSRTVSRDLTAAQTPNMPHLTPPPQAVGRIYPAELNQ